MHYPRWRRRGALDTSVGSAVGEKGLKEAPTTSRATEPPSGTLLGARLQVHLAGVVPRSGFAGILNYAALLRRFIQFVRYCY